MFGLSDTTDDIVRPLAKIMRRLKAKGQKNAERQGEIDTEMAERLQEQAKLTNDSARVVRIFKKIEDIVGPLEQQ